MQWITDTWDSWVAVVFWLTTLMIVLGFFGWLMPCNRGMYWWTNLRAAITDLCYWFVMPVFVRLCRTVFMAAGIVLLFGGGQPGFAFIEEMPLWQQLIAIQLLQDVYLYWMHRAFHSPVGWRFHSIHHSPKVLDWLSASRNHLINNLATFILADIAVQLMGFSPIALMILAPINIFWSSMVHANLNWTFGPFRFLLASPVFHRWHHTMEAEGLNKNFAPTFPLLDVIFGTFHMPAGKLPEEFGNGEDEFPEGFVGQLLYPFLGKPSSQAPVPQSSPNRKAA